jgi:hypothetical protein
MDSVSWPVRQKYMRAIHDLKDELNRELDAVQVGDPPRDETRIAWAEMYEARHQYKLALKE